MNPLRSSHIICSSRHSGIVHRDEKKNEKNLEEDDQDCGDRVTISNSDLPPCVNRWSTPNKGR